jgi:thioredoxin 1
MLRRGSEAPRGNVSILELTFANFDICERQMDQPGIWLWLWRAAWCEPSSAYAAAYEEMSAAHPDIVFATIDAETFRETARCYRLRSLPTLSGFRDGTRIFTCEGMLGRPALERIVARTRALEMERFSRECRAALGPMLTELRACASPWDSSWIERDLEATAEVARRVGASMLQ